MCECDASICVFVIAFALTPSHEALYDIQIPLIFVASSFFYAHHLLCLNFALTFTITCFCDNALAYFICDTLDGQGSERKV